LDGVIFKRIAGDEYRVGASAPRNPNNALGSGKALRANVAGASTDVSRAHPDLPIRRV
jgi:hypothetical protein